jgi:hypothetical protein
MPVTRDEDDDEVSLIITVTIPLFAAGFKQFAPPLAAADEWNEVVPPPRSTFKTSLIAAG